jgi:hypothetical protein
MCKRKGEREVGIGDGFTRQQMEPFDNGLEGSLITPLLGWGYWRIVGIALLLLPAQDCSHPSCKTRLALDYGIFFIVWPFYL